MANAVKIKWNGDKVLSKLDKTVERKMALIGEVVRAEAVKSVSMPTSTLGPSSPGDPPHIDTGKLRQSIFRKMISSTEVIVGTPLRYGYWLELGTAKMAARPFLRPALYNSLQKIRRIWGGDSSVDSDVETK